MTTGKELHVARKPRIGYPCHIEYKCLMSGSMS